MISMKKSVGYFLLAIFIIAILTGVYFFLVKGYPVNKSGLNSAVQNITGSTSVEVTNEKGSVTSKEISLVVISPKNGDTLSSTNVTVTGKTAPNADVFVNDAEGKADMNGNFSITLGLDEGKNQITVSANDANGNAAEETIMVNISSFQ